VTTLAPLRSPWTKAESVYHVQVMETLSHLLVKIQGWALGLVGCTPLRKSAERSGGVGHLRRNRVDEEGC
jgi:hypothetical protein